MADDSAEERLLEFLYACPVGLLECDASGDVGMMNPYAMQHLLPLCGDRDAGNLFAALEGHAPELRHLVAAFARPRGRVCDGHRITVDLAPGQDGVPKVLACTIVKLAANRFMVTLSDIGAQVAQERRLQQADAWFATLIDRINDHAVVTLSATGTVQGIDDGFSRITGQSADATLGRPLPDLLGPGVADGRVDNQLHMAAREGWHLAEGWAVRADGSRFWCQRLVVARQDGGFVMVLRDVPRRGEAAQELRRLLTSDHLTGAANRRRFGEALEQGRDEWARSGRPLALVALDLDHFKAINDTHGHPAGDALLCRTVDALTALLPEGALLARLGGEEFGVILPGHGLDDALALADAMRTAIATLEVPVAGAVVRATASFGCATLDEVAGSADGLVALGDERLYAAKRAGRNRVHRPLALAA